jgi:hypothetical protein
MALVLLESAAEADLWGMNNLHQVTVTWYVSTLANNQIPFTYSAALLVAYVKSGSIL